MVDSVIFFGKNLISSNFTINTVNLVAECVIVLKCSDLLYLFQQVFWCFLVLYYVFNIDQSLHRLQSH